MTSVRKVRQRVCIALFTFGLSLTVLEQTGCCTQLDHITYIETNQAQQIVLLAQ